MIKNILLAEDERGTALLVKTQLERYGYEVLLAYNGLQALDIIAKQPVDLVITDVVMPEMDGVDLYMELKKGKETANLPVIIVTDKQVFKESFQALGVDYFVPKASDISNLIEKIKTIEIAKGKERNLYKVIVGGTNSAVLDQMKSLLYGDGVLVSTAESSLDIVTKAFLMAPNVIVLDIGLKDNVTMAELIRSLRCYSFLKRSHILTYSHFSPEDIGGGNAGALDSFQEEVKACQEAGATKYLGRFNRAVFLDQIREFGLA
jgi:CheY-like chemotaxis protein